MEEAGGLPTATSGGGTPYEHVYTHGTHPHDPNDFENMSTHDLKHWLEKRGADLSGAVERTDLLDIARKLPKEGGTASGGGGPQ